MIFSGCYVLFRKVAAVIFRNASRQGGYDEVFMI
jgi:hypothetical protein